MILNTDVRQARTAFERNSDGEKQKALDYAQFALAHQVNLKDLENNPTIYARQLGKAMTHQEFERKLKKIDPNFTSATYVNGLGERKRALHHNLLGYLFSYEEGVMPEFSVKTTREVIIESPKTRSRDYVLQRADLPKSEWVPHTFNPDGSLKELGHFEREPGALSPGFEKIQEEYHEKIRGWRSVLSKLIIGKHQILSVTAVEKEFGGCDRLSWAENTGRL
jgi:hypothetical protein